MYIAVCILVDDHISHDKYFEFFRFFGILFDIVHGISPNKSFHVPDDVLRKPCQRRVDQLCGTENRPRGIRHLSAMPFHQFPLRSDLSGNVFALFRVLFALDVQVGFHTLHDIVYRVTFREHHIIHTLQRFQDFQTHLVIEVRPPRSFAHILCRRDGHHEDIRHLFRLLQVYDVSWVNQVKHAVAECSGLPFFFQFWFDRFPECILVYNLFHDSSQFLRPLYSIISQFLNKPACNKIS